jgi:hypothetical protein
LPPFYQPSESPESIRPKPFVRSEMTIASPKRWVPLDKGNGCQGQNDPTR